MLRCCKLAHKAQRERINALLDELTGYVKAEDEYHAHQVRQDLTAARSLARLVHKHQAKRARKARVKATSERVARDHAQTFQKLAETE